MVSDDKGGHAIGQNVMRKEAWQKVTGQARYADDLPVVGLLEARLLTSTYAHAKILDIDVSGATNVSGVKAVVTGNDCSTLFGPLLMDRPALARDIVRYAGEPVAVVVADTVAAAEQGVREIKVTYEPIPMVLTPSQALADGAVLVHPHVNRYTKVIQDVSPEYRTNVASRFKMIKGNSKTAFSMCKRVIERRFFLPPSDHMAMEVRSARAEIMADGDVHITTSTQAPYTIKKEISGAFQIPAGKIRVEVPFVGGAFGGKAPMFLELLAYLASTKVGGRAVRLTIPREQDIASAPGRIGLEAVIKMGADENGKILAADIEYMVDCGAYADITPYMTKAVAVDCTGPYNIENLSCEAVCVYTNHTYATSYRSFAHESYTFCIERVMDILAKECKIGPLQFRYINAIGAGNLTPSRVLCTESLVGNLKECLLKAETLSGWDGGKAQRVKENTVRVKGAACLWKTANPPTDAVAGAVVTFNQDGSVNLNTGVVEFGSGAQTSLAQMLAEKLGLNPSKVHVIMSVDTRGAPEYWKTVASLTGHMAGNAVIRAADDVISQLKTNGGEAFCCSPEEICVGGGRVYRKNNPDQYIPFEDIANGYKSPQGESIGEPVIGRGGFMLKGLSLPDPNTGEGKTGPSWTVGAQVVEVEADLKTYSYRLISASSVIDVGNAINPELMRAVIAGGMAMGAGMATRESTTHDANGIPRAPNMRTYKLMHIGEEPEYRVGFVETPDNDSPYGVRSYSEHGIIAMPAAIGNALSRAFEKDILTLPLTPESIWASGDVRGGGSYDTF